MWIKYDLLTKLSNIFSKKSDIKDNLTSTDTDKPLSANQGKVLNTAISGKANSSHTHGQITNDGKIGTTSGLPIITGTGGAVTTGSFGTTSGTFTQGNDSRLNDSRNPLFNQIPNDNTEKSLNTYRTGGFYYCSQDTYSRYIDNCPLAKANNYAFWLLVETWGASNYNYVKQTLTYYNTNKTYTRTKQGNSDANSSWSDWVELSKDTVYTHPNGTAKTGNPDGNKTPAFGGNFTVTQFTSNATGHISGATDRTITIPSTEATTSTKGLMTTTQVTDLTALKNRYDGKYIEGVATVTKPYLRLFHLESSNGNSSSSHIIFEIIGNNNDRLYAKIRVDMRQNIVGANGTNSSYSVTPLEVYGFNLDELYFGFYDNHVNNKTYLDIYRKVNAYVNFYIRIYDDHLRNGSYAMYKPVVNSTESYTDLSEASTSLYNASYTSTSQGGTYDAVTNTLPYTNMTANSFVKRGGTSSQLLLANGGVKATSDFATSSHNQATTTITNDQTYANIGSSLTNQKLINDNINTKLGNAVYTSNTSGLLKNDGSVMSGGTGASNYAIGNHNHSGTYVDTVSDTITTSSNQGTKLATIKANTTTKGTLYHPKPLSSNVSSGLYKIAVNTDGHITGTASVGSSDLPSHTHSYVPTSNVKNDLTTGGASNVLSAEQGKWLNNNKLPISTLIDASSSNRIDLNDYTTTGFYYAPDNTTYAQYITTHNDSVTNKSFWLLVEDWGSDRAYTKQTITYYNDNSTYTRIRNNGTWNAWKKLSQDGHTHGQISSDGKVTTTTSSVSNVLVTESDGTVKAINKLPSANVTHQDISGKLTIAQGSGAKNRFVYTDSSGNVGTKAQVGNLKIDGAIGTTSGNIITTTTNGVLQSSSSISSTKVTDANANNYSNIGSLSSGVSQQVINNAIDTALGNNVAVSSYTHTIDDMNFGVDYTSPFDYDISYIQFYKIGKLVIAYFRVKSNTNVTTSYIEFTANGINDGDVIPSEYRPTVETISHNFCHFNTDTPRILTTKVNTNGVVEMRGNTGTSAVNNYYTMIWVTD